MTSDPRTDPRADPRADLLERLVVSGGTHGISHLSLRELANSVGTSHRMILYHFGSREGLMTALVQHVEAAQRASMQELVGKARSREELLRSMWESVSAPGRRDATVLFFEMVSAAAQGRPGTEGFLDSVSSTWLRAGTEAASALGLDIDAADLVLDLAVVRGLLLEVIATDDRRTATLALERYIARR